MHLDILSEYEYVIFGAPLVISNKLMTMLYFLFVTHLSYVQKKLWGNYLLKEILTRRFFVHKYQNLKIKLTQEHSLFISIIYKCVM